MSEWYYTANGLREGPVTDTTIQDLVQKGTITADTQVWRKGMSAWQELRESELGRFVASEPPPISGQLINNTLVWIVAFLPLVFGIIDAVIAHDNQVNAIAHFSFGFPENQIPDLPWFIPVGVNCGLCLVDETWLKRAGYGSGWLKFFAVVLVPVYLFARAKRLKQRPSYAIAWVCIFVLSAYIYVGATS
jgi:hypothetical protein